MVTVFVNIERNNAGEPSCLRITLWVKFSGKFLTLHSLKAGRRSREKYLFVIKKLFLLSVLSFLTL